MSKEYELSEAVFERHFESRLAGLRIEAELARLGTLPWNDPATKDLYEFVDYLIKIANESADDDDERIRPTKSQRDALRLSAASLKLSINKIVQINKGPQGVTEALVAQNVANARKAIPLLLEAIIAIFTITKHTSESPAQAYLMKIAAAAHARELRTKGKRQLGVEGAINAEIATIAPGEKAKAKLTRSRMRRINERITDGGGEPLSERQMRRRWSAAIGHS
jgi:hypothetical protein